MKTVGKNPNQAKTVERLLEKELGVGTALSAAVVYKGQLAAAAACGSRDGNPENPADVGDLYNVGSISKVYCSAAVAKLVELGLVDWDTPVCGCLPGFSMKDGRFSKITLRMCLNHSSGLPGTGMRMAFTSRWLYDGYYDLMYEYLANSRLKAEPGEYSVYCNDGFDLAEMVVSKLSNMDYTEFIQKYITKSLGAISTCTGKNNPAGRFRVRQQGKGVEYLSVIGSGGISTDISDCAMFGYSFLCPGKIFSDNSIGEIIRPQGRGRLAGDGALQYGLGWDSVSLRYPGYDFGGGVLGKSGGTSQFLSYLIVIPEYSLAAAISGTLDTAVDKLKLICEICAQFLEAEGISVRKDISENLELKEYVRLPVGMDGIYYGNRGAFKLSAEGNFLCIRQYSPQGWQSWIENAEWDGSCFRSGTEVFWFEERDGSCYMFKKTPGGSIVLAQRISPDRCPGLNPVWEGRIGKKYILCNGNPWDTDVYELVNGLTLRSADNSGAVLFCAFEEGGGLRAMPAMTVNDTETDYMLDGTGALGARDTFAPFIYEEKGVEYLYDGGVRYRDTSSVPLLESGDMIFGAPMENQIFRICSGWRLEADEHPDVRYIMLDDELRPFYDQRIGDRPPLTCNGYIIFLNGAPAKLRLKVYKEQGE